MEFFFHLCMNVSDLLFILVFLSFISSLLFRILIVGKFLVLNGFPTILCFISVNEMFV